MLLSLLCIIVIILLCRNAVVLFALRTDCWSANANRKITFVMCAARTEKKANVSRQQTLKIWRTWSSHSSLARRVITSMVTVMCSLSVVQWTPMVRCHALRTGSSVRRPSLDTSNGSRNIGGLWYSWVLAWYCLWQVRVKFAYDLRVSGPSGRSLTRFL